MTKKISRRALMREMKVLKESHAKMAYILLGLLIQSDGVLTIDTESANLIDNEMTFTLSGLPEGAGWKISLDIPEIDNASAPPEILLTDG